MTGADLGRLSTSQTEEHESAPIAPVHDPMVIDSHAA